MSARKPLALAFVICGLAGTTVHADAISWPSGLNDWLIYLAAPSGSAGTGPVSYTVPSAPVIAPQAMPLPAVYTQPAAIPSAETVPDCTFATRAFPADPEPDSHLHPARRVATRRSP